MNIYAVIVAGGVGSRMNNALPKQFLPINGEPMLYYAINAFIKANSNIKIIIVLHPDYLSHFNTVLNCFKERINVQVVPGGATRFESVQKGINAITDAQPNDVVLVHDGARPLISATLINNLIDVTIKLGNAIPVIAIPESVRQIENNTSKPINRDTLRMVQTPQASQFAQIKKAFTQIYNKAFTDEATVLEADGNNINLIEGEIFNIKMTTPEQMEWAEYLLNKK